MNCSLIITTYNWKEALELVILSALNQSILPNEIIIADDGSKEDAKQLIDAMSINSKVPIIHSWQKDDGFRLAASRNKAIFKSKYEYIIVIDGDMIIDKNFIKDHNNCAAKGLYIQGSRVLLQNNLSKKILENKLFQKPSFFSSQVKNKQNMFYIPFLTNIICNNSNQELKRIRGCNFSLFKEDIIKVNGFNEDFITWGKEDSEFVKRLYNIGIKRKNLKFAGIQYHLYHPEGNASNNNIDILNHTIKNKLKWCENGINKY